MKLLSIMILILGILTFLHVERIESGGLHNLPDSPALIRHIKGERLNQPFGVVIYQKYSLLLSAISLMIIAIPKGSKKKQ